MTLTLTIKKQYFEAILSGQKVEEYRHPSAWLNSRLFDKDDNHKHYDYIKFVNGYHKNARYIVLEYLGHSTDEKNNIYILHFKKL